jgi:2-polyprenyl-3-methyl-5-hydroxy-6-metoxy-1,4-benzoquinol methylase
MMQTTSANPSQDPAHPCADSSNVSHDEIARFDKLAARWWDPDGESRPLHDLNPVRAAYVAERVPLRYALGDIGGAYRCAARRSPMWVAAVGCSAKHWRAPVPMSSVSILG